MNTNLLKLTFNALKLDTKLLPPASGLKVDLEFESLLPDYSHIMTELHTAYNQLQ